MTWADLLRESENLLNTADHLFYVTFKHNKSAEVIKAAIERLAQSIEKFILAVLNFYKEKGEIENIPNNPKLQADLFVELLENKGFYIRDFIQTYFLLRKLARSQHKGLEEFRRTIKIVFVLPSGEEYETNPREIQDKLEKVKEEINFLKEKIFSVESLLS